MSRVLRKARAASGVEATTIPFVPIFRYITGPYFWARLKSVTCGMEPRRGRAPRNGHPAGPGGSFRRDLKTMERKKRVV